ncbi:MAG: putative ABC transport system permease protein [Alphaproteobacteria bacterium]|jgi:putative ABC transport system permease protein
MWLRLAWQSLLNRKVTTILTFSALLVSVSLLFAIEHIRVQTQDNFKRTVSGIDLVVAARSSQVNVLLSSVFRMGANPNSLRWETYENIGDNEKVVWTIPLALGDSYKGFPVVGTSSEYFDYYQYGRKQALKLASGRVFASPTEAVIGANVASSLRLEVGQSIVVSHGSGSVSFSHHDHHPVLITGILSPTGTPVDKSVHVPLIAIEEMHSAVAPVSLRTSFARPNNETKASKIEALTKDSDHDHEHGHDDADSMQAIPIITPGTYDLIGEPKQISAFMLKAESPFAILTLQRDINRYQDEAISAIMPQVALAELWQTLGSIETVMQVIALLVLFASLIGLVTMLLASMHERRNEISALRAVGASPWFIGSLIQAEAIMISVFALVGAYLVVTLAIVGAGHWLLSEYSLYVSANIYSTGILFYAGSVLVLTVVVAFIPAFTAYRSAKYLFT